MCTSGFRQNLPEINRFPFLKHSFAFALTILHRVGVSNHWTRSKIEGTEYEVYIKLTFALFIVQMCLRTDERILSFVRTILFKTELIAELWETKPQRGGFSENTKRCKTAHVIRNTAGRMLVWSLLFGQIFVNSTVGAFRNMQCCCAFKPEVTVLQKMLFKLASTIVYLCR